jgi:hypothetical protein
MLKQVLLTSKDGVPLNFIVNYLRSMLKEGLKIDTTFNPP